MNTQLLSFYDRPNYIRSKKEIPFDILLENIRNGTWQDVVLPIRAMEYDSPQQEEAKRQCPSVTIAGVFSERIDAGLSKSSGLIAMDIDDKGLPPGVGAEQFKQIISRDPYTVAAFISLRGRGVCAIFRINPDKHREAFAGLCEYIFNNYRAVCDTTSVNPSRARFVSFDPYIYIADHKPSKFTEYPKEKPPSPKKIGKYLFVGDDFARILNQIQDGGVNITQDSYHVWLRIGFALAHKFGESGRSYFHTVSQYSSKYDFERANRQYNACVRHKQTSGVPITMAAFFYYCKEAGIELYSERTKKIIYAASSGKKSGISVESVTQNLSQFENVSGDDISSIVSDVYTQNITLPDDSLLEQLEIWVRQNYSLKRNEITRYIETDTGVALQKKDLNSIFIRAKKLWDKLSFELIDRLIDSDFIPTYNPLMVWFNERKSDYPDTGLTENIDALFNTITSRTPDKDLYFFRKWIVGMISTIHGEHSPLTWILAGRKQNTGKTEYFRRLLPRELFKYYAESKLDAGKDDEILMTQKLLIVDDEFGGKSKREDKHMKSLTSKEWFSLREPYGRGNVDLKRLAVLGGTSNDDDDILTDWSGNRRYLPVYVEYIDHAKYNSIDKRAVLMEAYWLWKNGFQWKLNADDIAYLKQGSEHFESVNVERELIQQYYVPGEIEVTASQIKVYLENRTRQRLSLVVIGKELKRLGFEQIHRRVGNSTGRYYRVQYTAGHDVDTPGVIPMANPYNVVKSAPPANGGYYVPGETGAGEWSENAPDVDPAPWAGSGAPGTVDIPSNGSDSGPISAPVFGPDNLPF
jgi:predicted P-loop ATPase